jgi:hypothetical protein
MLLGKLIYTLAVLVHSAENTIVLENMIKAMLDFLIALTNHPEL